MYAILRTKNEGLKSEVVDFAQQLIQTPSPSLEEGKAADLVEQRMNDLGYDKVMRDEVGNVLGLIIGREGNPTVLLNSHMDTILPAESDRDQAYSGRIDGNLMYGLGAADCKAGLAAQIYAGALLRRSLLPFRGNLAVAATVAEENGRSIGVRALMEHTLPDLELEPGFAVLAEPTGLGLYYGHDGWVEMQIRVEGANPFQVDDAARAILNDLNAKAKSGDVVSDIEAMEIGDAHFEDVNGSRCATIEMTRRLGAAESVEEVLDQTKQVASLLAQPAGSVAVEVMTATESQKLYNG